MLRAFFLVMIFTTIISCKKEEGNYHGGYYWIYGYGLSDIRVHEAMEGISEKWKIKIVDVAGCMIDPKLQKKVDEKNKKTYAAIEERYGKGWKIKYDKDIEGFAAKKIDVMDVLITNKLFRNELKKHYIEIDDVDKVVKELNDNLYNVVVYNDKLKTENKECFRVSVNTKNRIVQLK